jgi:hypothetical protein
MSLRWTFGETPEKTPLRERQRPAAPTPAAYAPTTPQSRTSPPEEDNVCLNTIKSAIYNEAIKPRNREELADRLNHREQIIQVTQNPFRPNSYIQDLENQERFLRGK